MSRPLSHVVTSFSFTSVAILSHDFSFRLQPPFSFHHFSSESGLSFLIALYVATSVFGCDHISVSTALPQVVTFVFRLRPPFWSFALIWSEFMSRPQ